MFLFLMDMLPYDMAQVLNCTQLSRSDTHPNNALTKDLSCSVNVLRKLISYKDAGTDQNSDQTKGCPIPIIDI